MPTRRCCLKLCLAAAGGVTGGVAGAADREAPVRPGRGTPPAEVLDQVRRAMPSQGGRIPADLAGRFGIALAGCKYALTSKPILEEGAERILATGARAAKFWLGDLATVYRLNSDWRGYGDGTSFVDRIRHPSFLAALALPFEAVALEVGSAPGTRLCEPGEDYARDEEAMHALAAHLYSAYADKPCTFILQNWEGDWLVRGEHKDWSKQVPDNAIPRLESIAAWWRARQRGVARARAEAPAAARCRVLHAAEVNRVADAFRGIPVATTHALPEAPVDLVSWSCYDGLNDPVLAWQCLDLLEKSGRKEGGGRAPIMIGEIGKPETGQKREDVVAWWDRALGVLLARKVSHIFHWELYCNEPRDPAGRRADPGPHVKPDDMRGFWWVRPDGTTSWGGAYLERVLARAGERGLG